MGAKGFSKILYKAKDIYEKHRESLSETNEGGIYGYVCRV